MKVGIPTGGDFPRPERRLAPFVLRGVERHVLRVFSLLDGWKGLVRAARAPEAGGRRDLVLMGGTVLAPRAPIPTKARG
jgi:hypothetical protein